ncbi:MAG: fimbrial protein, partial [Bacteroidales bacterium]|nr:fimbrial protein [Bacteroidales bacterium]
MKNKFLLIMAMFGLVTVGCQKDSVKSSFDKEGEKGLVTLSISSELPKTRGSVGEETATAAEVKIDATKGLKVYVFNEDGSLDYASPGVLSLTEIGANLFQSEIFEVTAGNKYFFVFANDPESGGKITAPTSTTIMENFLSQAVTTIGAGDALDIAEDNNFLLA